MPIRFQRWAGAAALSMSFAHFAAAPVWAEELATPTPAVQDQAAPVGQEATAAEQQLPSPQVQEALIRSSLLSFSDASTTGDWSVFLANASDHMREITTVEKLQVFNGYVTSLNVPSLIASDPITPQLAVINNGNHLYLKGTEILQDDLVIEYELQYDMAAQGWKLRDIGLSKFPARPNVAEQEALVRSTFATFNSANISGNYSILYSKLPKAQRDAVSFEKFKARYISPPLIPDLTAALGKPMSLNNDPKIDENGQLRLEGTFHFSDSTFVKIDVIYLYEGEWKPAVINLDGHFTTKEGLAK